eukprot:6024739-Ditylum_brightwellii.AAC.1
MLRGGHYHRRWERKFPFSPFIIIRDSELASPALRLASLLDSNDLSSMIRSSIVEVSEEEQLSFFYFNGVILTGYRQCLWVEPRCGFGYECFMPLFLTIT